MESAQRIFTKYIVSDLSLDYKARLKVCDILPLSFRRECLDLVFIFNSINYLNDFDLNSIANFHDDNRRNFDHISLVSVIPTPHTEGYLNFFTNRVIKLWNSLAIDIRETELSHAGLNTICKNKVKEHYHVKLVNNFVTDSACSWTSCCRCSVCKT